VSRPPPATRAEFKVWRKITTRWADNDAYGHVNNTVYYEWFDSAVNAWMVDQGMLEIANGDPIALVVETRCTYAAPLTFPEKRGRRPCRRAARAFEHPVLDRNLRRRLGKARRPRVNSSTSWWNGLHAARPRSRTNGG